MTEPRIEDDVAPEQERRPLFDRNSLTDQELLAAADWMIRELENMKRSISRSRPEAFGARGKEKRLAHTVAGLAQSIRNTVSSRRAKAEEVFENSAEVKLLREIFGATK